MVEDKTWKQTLGDRQGGKEFPFGGHTPNPVEQMDAFAKVQKTAETIAKTDKLEAAATEAKEAAKASEERARKSDLALVEEKMGGRLDKIENAIVASASPKTVASGAKSFLEDYKAFKELGGGETSKFSDFVTVLKYAQEQNPSKSIAALIKEAEDLKKALGISGEKEKPAEIPASIMLETKKMDRDLQLQLETMRDDRARRDKEFELRIKQWELEREDKKEEIAARIHIEQERNKMIGGLGEKVGRVMFSAASDMAPQGAQISQRPIQANEGEFGEVVCPSCKSTIPIAGDAMKAICPGCATIFPVQRIKAQASPPTLSELEPEE